MQIIFGSEKEINILRQFAFDCSTNFDCDEDAHTYGTTCRSCYATAILAHFGTRPGTGGPSIGCTAGDGG